MSSRPKRNPNRLKVYYAYRGQWRQEHFPESEMSQRRRILPAPKCYRHERHGRPLVFDEDGRLYCPGCRTTEMMLMAVDREQGLAIVESEREYAKRLLMVHRRHNHGRDALTGELSTHYPMIFDGSVKFPPDVQAELEEIMQPSPYYGRVLRTWQFQEWELVNRE